MIEIKERDGIKEVYDTDNPNLYQKYFKCAECGEWVEEDETLWVNPVTGKATMRWGKPYHDYCAPEEL